MPANKPEYMRAWRARNLEKVRSQAREYAASHKVERRAYLRKYNESNNASILYYQAKFRAARDGLPFGIELSDVIIPKVCPVLGIPLVRGTRQKHDNSPSLDRIEPEKGYVKGNIHVISLKANRAKNNLTLEELKRLASYFDALLNHDRKGNGDAS